MSYYTVPEGQSASFSANEGGGLEGGRVEILQQEEWNVDRMAGAGTGEGGPTLTSGLEQAFFQISMQPTQGGPQPGGELPHTFPERPGEPDCGYFLRTGQCAFGSSCRFHHPMDRRPVRSPQIAKASPRYWGSSSVGGVDWGGVQQGGGDGFGRGGAAGGQGEFPERMGQNDCQYFLKTGMCKFGPSCKYNHPKEEGASVGARIMFNPTGYPVRLGEKECVYYMQNGQCKYGSTCKFNHPHLHTPPLGPASPTMPGMQWGVMPRGGGYIPTPRPSQYPPIMMPSPGMPIQAWPFPMGQNALPMPVTDSGGVGGSGGYMFAHLQDPSAMMRAGGQGPYPPFVAGTNTLPSSVSSSVTGKDANGYPQRPGQPECNYYLKTGECKFGMTCRFHHPADITHLPPPNSMLSPMGLPLREGSPACPFYIRYGICKYGHTCRFDHPIRATSEDPLAIERKAVSGDRI